MSCPPKHTKQYADCCFITVSCIFFESFIQLYWQNECLYGTVFYFRLSYAWDATFVEIDRGHKSVALRARQQL